MFAKFRKTKLRIFLFILFVFSSSSIYALDSRTKNLLKEDCEYLYYCWTNGYIVNESLEDSGFDVKDAISKIEKDYPKQEKFILKNFPDKAVYEKGIDKFALSVLIQTRLYEKNNIKDSHYSLNSGSVKFGLPSNKAYFSDLFFIEDNGSYSATGNNIYNGKKYTGDPVFLKRCIHENQEMFRFISTSDVNIAEVNISLDGEDFLFPVHQEKTVSKSENMFDFQEFQNTLYIKLSTCSFEKNEDYLSFLSFLDSIRDLKKTNIVIDFRDNSGGIRKIPYELLMGIFCENDESKIDFKKNIDFAEQGEKEIVTALTLSDSQLNNDNRIYSSGNKTVVSSTVTQPNDGLAESKIKIDSKIYILMNNKTASAAEMGVACAYLLGKENIVLIGENSSGCVDYADPHTYTLPNSKIEIRLCSTEFKNCSLLKDNQNYFGDSYGFFPDYWTTNDDLDMSLQYLTKDDSVSIE